MSNARFLPIMPADPVSKWMDNFFNSTLAQVMGSDHALSTPAVNVVEFDDRFEMHLAAPGLTKADFNIRIENGALVISAEKKTENAENTPKYTRKEFSYHTFRRSFHLDDMIDREKISATYDNGVLNISLPKREDVWKKTAPTNIEIR
jgi:HSP20 family protein